MKTQNLKQPNHRFKIGIVGATGVVGKCFLELLQERKFPVEQMRLFASENSAGSQIKFFDHFESISQLSPGCFKGLDLVFFSSGDEISKIWAPQCVNEGAWVVDNSASFRMAAGVELIVPEVNLAALKKVSKPSIIANPNCSTIQLVVALNPLQQKFGIEDVRVATYQSVSGAGVGGIQELMSQRTDHENGRRLAAQTFPHVILDSCIPQIGSFSPDGRCAEEVKIVNETKKIMGLPKFKISAFTVRVPVPYSHAEAVWITLRQEVKRENFVSELTKAPGILIEDSIGDSLYPLQNRAAGKDAVFCGRIHQDPDDMRTWKMWIVADNLRKGAALNGIQIAEAIFDIS